MRSCANGTTIHSRHVRTAEHYARLLSHEPATAARILLIPFPFHAQFRRRTRRPLAGSPDGSILRQCVAGVHPDRRRRGPAHPARVGQFPRSRGLARRGRRGPVAGTPGPGQTVLLRSSLIAPPSGRLASKTAFAPQTSQRPSLRIGARGQAGWLANEIPKPTPALTKITASRTR